MFFIHTQYHIRNESRDMVKTIAPHFILINIKCFNRMNLKRKYPNPNSQLCFKKCKTDLVREILCKSKVKDSTDL